MISLRQKQCFLVGTDDINFPRSGYGNFVPEYDIPAFAGIVLPGLHLSHLMFLHLNLPYSADPWHKYEPVFLLPRYKVPEDLGI